MLKFRTMIRDAEQRLQELAHLNVSDGMTKIPDDPRVTRLGKWLRRYSLDELPQLFNVLAGHMSLVGPRPYDVHELPIAAREKDPRLSVRPGLTGLWQVNARSDPRIASRVHHDLQYVGHWSLLLDAKIMARTVPVVLLGKGGQVNRNPSTADGRDLDTTPTPVSHLDQPQIGPSSLPHKHSGPSDRGVGISTLALGEEGT